MSLEEAKKAAARAVDGLAPVIKAASREIHDNPELGLVEFKASALLTGLLEGCGYTVRRGVAGLDTAFVATSPWPPRGGSVEPADGAAGLCPARPGPFPTVALLAEYDALPGVGHGCGHNFIGAASVGAAMALAGVAADSDPFPGSLRVVGCPAEEGAVDGAGGKVALVEAGVFDDVDAALMVHPGSADSLSGRSTCRVALEVSFRGKAAHAAGAPHEGINALEAVLQTLNAINALRQHLPGTVLVHGIVARGGDAPNVVPDDGIIRLYVRAPDPDGIEPAVEKVKNCARGAAMATGCQVSFREFARSYLNLVPNRPLDEVFARNMAALGRPPARSASDGRGTGSTDMGNVSHVVPAIHPYVAITRQLGAPPSHSREFAAASVSPEGEEALIVAAKALAMTCLDLLLSPETLQAVRDAGPNSGETDDSGGPRRGRPVSGGGGPI